MKIDVVEITENEDGSANVSVDFDVEALQVIVQAFMTGALTKLVETPKWDGWLLGISMEYEFK